MHTQYGYGDPETWGPVTSPRDPRWDEDDWDDEEDEEDEEEGVSLTSTHPPQGATA